MPTRLASGVCRATLLEVSSRPRALVARRVDILLCDAVALFDRLLNKYILLALHSSLYNETIALWATVTNSSTSELVTYSH
jgi:hypothetical protein